MKDLFGNELPPDISPIVYDKGRPMKKAANVPVVREQLYRPYTVVKETPLLTWILNQESRPPAP